MDDFPTILVTDTRSLSKHWIKNKMSSQIELLYEIDEHDKDKSLSIIEMEKKVFCLREELQKREDILQESEVLYNVFFISQVK